MQAIDPPRDEGTNGGKNYAPGRFCAAEHIIWRGRSNRLGEALEGNALIKSDYLINFRKNMKELFAMCPVILSRLESKTYTYDNWQALVKDYNCGVCK